jgi:phytoene desaturase
MYSVVEGMVKMAKELGVHFKTNQTVEKICVENGKTTGVVANGKKIDSDVVVSGADYNHSESLLSPKERGYSDSYWNKKVFAPSSLLFFIGLDKKVKNVSHHTLFFDVDFDEHAKSIYDNPKWPKEPLFYGNFPSMTDKSMAPEGKEACFLLIPIAPGIEDSEEMRSKYFNIVIKRLEHLTKQSI